jgi:hypothetical protein
MNTSVKILVAAAILLAPTASFARGGMHGGNAGGNVVAMDHSMSTSWQGNMSSNQTSMTNVNKHQVNVQKIDARLIQRGELLDKKLLKLLAKGKGNSREAMVLRRELHRIQQTVFRNEGV